MSLGAEVQRFQRIPVDCQSSGARDSVSVALSESAADKFWHWPLVSIFAFKRTVRCRSSASAVFGALPRSAHDIVRQWISRRWRRALLGSAPQNKRSRGFLLCFFPACTLPQVLCQSQTYCSGISVPAQLVAPAAATRTTASWTEQKTRTPVWFTPIGDATS